MSDVYHVKATVVSRMGFYEEILNYASKYWLNRANLALCGLLCDSAALVLD